jgi:hypothetical protein
VAERPLTDLMQRVLVATLDARDREHYPPTPNEVGHRLNLVPARRRRGPWSGPMGAAQRVITPLVALSQRGLLTFARRRDGRSGTAYGLTDAGFAKARELREAGVTADKPVTVSESPTGGDG